MPKFLTSQEDLDRTLSTLETHGKNFIIFAAEKSTDLLVSLRQKLSDLGASYGGGVFPSLIWDGSLLAEGIVLIGFPAKVTPLLVHSEHTTDTLEALASESFQSLLLLADGLSRSTEGILKTLYNSLGNQKSYMGCGAGYSDLAHRPCLFDDRGDYQDAVLLFPILAEMDVSDFHGWQSSAHKLVATKTQENIIEELNWRPAAEVYIETVEAQSGKAFDRNKFYETASNFPLGIEVQQNEFLIRDPFMVTDQGHLVCVGDVPENSVLSLMAGTPEELIQKTEENMNRISPRQLNKALVFDCISRSFLLAEKMEQELAYIHERNQELGLTRTFGALSLGEISSESYNSLQFMNKSVVIGYHE